jgi:hypothetical protein
MLGKQWPRAGVPGGSVLACMLLLAIGPLAAGAARSQPPTSPGPTGTAAATTLPEPLTREALRDLLAQLSDSEARELLLAELDRQIAARMLTAPPED